MLSLSGLFIGNQAMAEKLYKWVDKDGITHFSEHPGANEKNEVIKPKTGHSDPVTYNTAAPAPSTGAKSSTADIKAALKDPERCASARKNQDMLKTFARIKIQGDNSEYRYLTPDEQKQKMSEASKAIEESCN